MMHTERVVAFLLVGVALMALSSTTRSQDLSECAAIEKADARLACYDRKAGRATLPATPDKAATPEPREERPFGMIARSASPLDDRWELTPDTKRPLFTFRPYKPVYFLPVFYSSKTNEAPCSQPGGSGNDCVTQPIDLDNTEAKIQISFKTKVATGLFGGNGDIWAAYTQSSRWQVYNGDLSRPFRETNYEPELMMTFATDYNLLGWKASMLGFGVNHQSNGRADPLSRSWNRFMVFAALQKDDWVISAKPWYRIPEAAEKDDNPDIEDYMGRMELLINRRWRQHNFALTLRHSLRAGSDSHGSGTFEWTFPIYGYLKGYMQLFSGYGESMIDYNFKKNAFGIGISLVDWR